MYIGDTMSDNKLIYHYYYSSEPMRCYNMDAYEIRHIFIPKDGNRIYCLERQTTEYYMKHRI